MKTSFLFLADGFEEIEALATIDILRRAEIMVKTVAVSGNEATGAHGITVKADLQLESVLDKEPDWMIFPGGMPGASNLTSCTSLMAKLRTHYQHGGRIAAICAAPAVVLAQAGLLQGRKATCYPGFEQALGDAYSKGSNVVVDGNIITANGPGSAFDFALAIVKETFGAQASSVVSSAMMLK